VTTLDAAIGQPVSFIKMDLEGWELNALEGSRAHILEDRPKLAISVYHAGTNFGTYTTLESTPFFDVPLLG